MLKIQVLHNRECNFWQVAWQTLEQMIAEGKLDAHLEEVLIADDIQARQFRFAGSPQVMINGQDIDPEASRVTNFHASGCRPYFWQGEHSDYPPRAMLEEAVEKLSR